MATKMFLFLMLTLIIIGCTNKVPTNEIPPEKYTFCNSDQECVPQPGCHPLNCINSEFTGKFESPDVCTLMYSCNAAYQKEDCACQNNKCINIKPLVGDPNCNN